MHIYSTFIVQYSSLTLFVPFGSLRSQLGGRGSLLQSTVSRTGEFPPGLLDTAAVGSGDS